jgi:hypothetical protein
VREARWGNHSNTTGALLGGLVGGLVLGTVLGSATQAHAQAEYVYQDPYTDRYYPTQDAYLDQCRYERHPRVVRVIDTRTRRCVRTSRYDGGRWVDVDPGYGYGGYGGYDDRGSWYRGDGRTWDRERGESGKRREISANSFGGFEGDLAQFVYVRELAMNQCDLFEHHQRGNQNSHQAHRPDNLNCGVHRNSPSRGPLGNAQFAGQAGQRLRHRTQRGVHG